MQIVAYKWLTSRINVWAMKRMAADDLDIFWEMLLKRSNLRSFA
jgi:hypothetical protein